jgi:hypothetical protein
MELQRGCLEGVIRREAFEDCLLGNETPSRDVPVLAKEIECKRPGLAVELGYEMHYSETLGFARKVVKEGVLGDITTARFHGGCPSGAGMDLASNS